MATLQSWIWKYKAYVDEEVWSMIGLYLNRYSLDIFGPGREHKDARELDLDKYLRCELFIMGFLETYDIYNCKFEKYEEVLEDYKNGKINSKKLHYILTDLDRKYPKVFVSEQVVRKMSGEEEAKKFFDFLLKIFHIDNSKNDFTPGTVCNWYERCVWQHIYARKGRDKDFAEELRRFFVSAKEDGKRKTPLDVLFFCIDWMKVREKKENDIDIFSVSETYANMQKAITEKVICQDSAVRKFVQGLFNGQVKLDEDRLSPEATFLFVGPPGVGKTYLAQTAAEVSGRPYRIFPMSEYANTDSFHGLIGFEATWRNAQEGALTSYVSENENAILIFDEIEKAHKNTIHQFLPVLEGGFLRDLYTETDVDFTHTIVIFTTNAGRDFYEEKRDMALSSMSEATLLNALRKDKDEYGNPKLPSEILSRMSKGGIIGFNPMDPAKLVPIIKKGMSRGSNTISQTMHMDCEYDESLLPYLFLYHMGSEIDARVADARSESFIKESVYRIAEKIGERGKKNRKDNAGRKVKVRFELEENDLARELTSPAQPPELLVVCNQTDLDKIKPKKDQKGKYKIYHVYAEKEGRDYAKYISEQLRDHKITAILVDPLMRESKDEQLLEGLGNRNTMGNDVIEWLGEQKDIPPVYCLEFSKNHKIGFADRQDLYLRGVKGILPVADAASQEKRVEMVYSLLYEQFLNDKLSWLTSRGKALDFGIATRRESTEEEEIISIIIRDFRLIRSLDTEAAELFVDDEKLKGDTFDSVIGGESAKRELKKFIRFIKDPELYKRSGQQVSKGILMYGPPGSGKTKLARAMASEADCPFISTTGSQFIRGERSMTEVFRVARKYAPCILFIDEIESFALDSRAGHSYPEITKQLMTEMDGFNKSDKPVFVIAATNAAKAPNLGERNVFLDGPLMRRFSKSVYMKWPDRKERIAFVKMVREDLKNKQYNFNRITDEDIVDFADLSAGHSLSQIETVLEQVTGRAAESDEQPTKELLIACFEEYVYGEEKNYSKEHVRTTARHEAGHAFMGFYCDGDSSGRFAPEYATIIARGGYLGLVRQQNDESHSGYSKSELLKLIRIKLAGRAAELEFAENEDEGLTTGASNDLEHATDIAADLLSAYGMEEGFMATLPKDVMLQSDLAKEYYEKLNSILNREMELTRQIIHDNLDKVEALADALLDRSRLDMDEMREIIG